LLTSWVTHLHSGSGSSRVDADDAKTPGDVHHAEPAASVKRFCFVAEALAK